MDVENDLCPETTTGWLWYCYNHRSHGSAGSAHEAREVSKAHRDFMAQLEGAANCDTYSWQRSPEGESIDVAEHDVQLLASTAPPARPRPSQQASLPLLSSPYWPATHRPRAVVTALDGFYLVCSKSFTGAAVFTGVSDPEMEVHPGVVYVGARGYDPYDRVLVEHEFLDAEPDLETITDGGKWRRRQTVLVTSDDALELRSPELDPVVDLTTRGGTFHLAVLTTYDPDGDEFDLPQEFHLLLFWPAWPT